MTSSSPKKQRTEPRQTDTTLDEADSDLEEVPLTEKRKDSRATARSSGGQSLSMKEQEEMLRRVVKALTPDIVKEAAQGVQAVITPMVAQLGRHERKLERDVRELKMKCTTRDPGANANDKTDKDFEPRWVELLGWCEYSERREKGLSRDECKALCESALQLLPEDLREHWGQLIVF